VYLVAWAAGCGSSGEPAPPGSSNTRDSADASADGSAEDGAEAGSAAADSAAGSDPDAGAVAGRDAAGVDAGGDAAATDSSQSTAGDGDVVGDGEPPAEGPDGAACTSGGIAVSSSRADATGGCAAPYLIDLRDGAFGDVFVHITGTQTSDADAAPIDKCGEATARDVVYNVMLPVATDLEISVRAPEGSDSDLAILAQRGPDPSCVAEPTTACVDDNAAGECEYMRLRAGADGFDDDTPQVIVSEYVASDAPLSVHFRLADPEGGS
jgi:hypothetical protein